MAGVAVMVAVGVAVAVVVVVAVGVVVVAVVGFGFTFGAVVVVAVAMKTSNKRLTIGQYRTHNTQLIVHVLHVRYQSDIYAKIKYRLLHSSTDFYYEERNAKVYKSFISHWEKV